MNSRAFAHDITRSAAHVVEVKDRDAAGIVQQAQALESSTVYILTERRWFHEQKVQEVKRVGVTPEGDITIIAKPPLLTFDVVLYHARWSLIPIGMGLLVSIGIAIGHTT